MKQFMFIYRSKPDEPEKSAEDMQADMEAWMRWVGRAIEAGWMAETGDALDPESGSVVRAAGVTDGPYVESKEIVGGFSLVQADDLAAATRLADGCPAIGDGGSVEVRELMNVGAE